MNYIEIGELIAERILDFKARDGRQKAIRIRLGKPKPAKEGDWVCPYEIIGFEKTTGLKVYGVDAMQALLLAIKSIIVDLQKFALNENGEFSWLENKGGGFPKFDEI